MLAPAAAADLSVAPIYGRRRLPIATWTGSYIGICGGRRVGQRGGEQRHHGVLDQTPRLDLSGGSSASPGDQLQSGNWVIGYEGDTSVDEQEGERAGIPAQRRLQQRGEGALALDLPRPRRLPRTIGSSMPPPVVPWPMSRTRSVHRWDQISERHWHWGWTAGAGVEVKLSQDWSAKMEYLYVGLQDKSYFNPAPSAVFPSNQSVARRRPHRARRRELQAALERARQVLQALNPPTRFAQAAGSQHNDLCRGKGSCGTVRGTRDGRL